MEQDKKLCPYCGEEIQAAAKKCRHCGEWLDGREATIKNRGISDIHQISHVKAPSKPKLSINISGSNVLSFAIILLIIGNVAIGTLWGMRLYNNNKSETYSNAQTLDALMNISHCDNFADSLSYANGVQIADNFKNMLKTTFALDEEDYPIVYGYLAQTAVAPDTAINYSRGQGIIHALTICNYLQNSLNTGLSEFDLGSFFQGYKDMVCNGEGSLQLPAYEIEISANNIFQLSK